MNKNPMIKALMGIEQSPAMKAALKTLKGIEATPAMKALMGIEQSPAMKAALKTLKGIEATPAMKALMGIEQSPTMKAVIKTLKGIEASPMMKVFSEMTIMIHAFEPQPLTFSEAFYQVALAYESSSKVGVAEPWEEVTSKFEERAIHAPKGPLSLEFFLTLVVTLVFFLYSQKLNSESELRILNSIRAMEAHFTEQLATLQEQKEEDTFYIVERPITLRKGPDTKAPKITLLYPNIKVRVVERRAKWIMVEYFDYLEDVHKAGWVPKKYLKRMKENK
jgi:hypothetical protein